MNDDREPVEPVTEPAAEPAVDDRDEAPDDYRTLYAAGIRPGLPNHMTKRAKKLISTSGCVVTSDLYQEFLRDDGALPPKGSDDGLKVARSSMGKQVELAREVFERVCDGEDVVHVSGGGLNVYGESDFMFTMARGDEATDVPIEIVPGVIAALGGVAMIGASLSNDFCTVSLPDKWYGWGEIEERLCAAVVGGLVIVLYDRWRDRERAINMAYEEWADDAPVGIFNDAGRGKIGRNLDDGTLSMATLGDAKVHDNNAGGMGTSILIGTHEAEPWSSDHQTYLVAPRGGRDVDDF